MPTTINGDTGVDKLNFSQIATGTPSATTFLRGDNTWATASSVPTTAQVLDATASATAGAIGTYALLATVNSTASVTLGQTFSGSSLQPFGLESLSTTDTATGKVSGTVAGTWRCFGYKLPRTNDNGNTLQMTLFLRIS